MIWSEIDTKYLKANYPEKGPTFCASSLKRSYKSCVAKAARLKLKYLNQNKYLIKQDWTPPEGYAALEPYIRSSKKILVRHSCGYEWAVSPNNLQKLVACPECSGKIVDYEERLSTTNYEALEEYRGTEVKILHRHKVCGFEWHTKPHDILQLSGCPNCTSSGPCYLYLLYFPSLDVCKVGMAADVEKRSKRFGVDYILVAKKLFSSRGGAYLKEQEILGRVTLCNTGLLANGNTETFNATAPEIEKLLQDF